LRRYFGRLSAVVTVVSGLVAAGCVFPTPPPGVPVPGFTIGLSGTSPYAGTVTVSVTPFNYAPASVRYHLDGATTPTFVDSEAPFEYPLDTATLNDGTHKVRVEANDATYTVSEKITFVTRNDPNIVVIVLDDLDATTTPFWDAMPQTNALLAGQGLQFTNAFATDPVCCPARATLLTGRYPHNTGVWDNSRPDGGFVAFVSSGAENDTIATRLDAAGYETALVGKYFNEYIVDPGHVPPGWDEWFGLVTGYYDGYTYLVNHNGGFELYGSDVDDYQTDVLSTQALAFLDAQELTDDRPFLLWLSPSAPHWVIPPAPRHAVNEFTDDDLPTHPNYDETDVGDKPTWLRDGVPPISAGLAGFLVTDHRTRMGSLLAVDEMIAALVQRLSTTGELDDTIIVFVSDNGYNLGAHRLAAKQAPYEESIRVPMLMTGPGIPTGQQSASLVTHADLAPTLLDVAGLTWDDTDGRSLVPLFAGPPASWRDDFLVEFKGTYGVSGGNFDTLAQVQAAIQAGKAVQVPTFRAVRNGQYAYIEWYGTAPHEYELYDLVADPYQLDNLLATPEGAAQYASMTATLQARLEALGSCAAATCRE
jgi:arylsulfatase A-like enzyme